MKRPIVSLLILIAAVVIGAAGVSAQFIPTGMQESLDMINSMYGTNYACTPCHGSAGPPLNGYGQAFVNAGGNPFLGDISANRAALRAIQPLDSDSDGFSNIAEINARTLPGDPASRPLSSLIMPRPVSGQQAVAAPTSTAAFTNADPIKSIPFGFGSLATGGTTFDLQVKLAAFNGPVDIYLAIQAPLVLGPELFVVSAGGVGPISQVGLSPWIANTTAATDTTFFTNLPVSNLAEGVYRFFLAVTPAGNPATFYIWASDFKVGKTLSTATFLNGSQMVPPVTTTGQGVGTMDVNLITGALSSQIDFSGLSGASTAAHIHQGAAGNPLGPIVIPFEGGQAVTTGTWRAPAGSALTLDRVAALMNDQLYYVVHSQANPGGEIRGQIIFPDVITTTLSGAEMVPPVATSGRATGTLTVNLVTGVTSGQVTFSGLSGTATAAHIHVGSVGTPLGTIIVNLAGGAGSTSGTWAVPAGTILTAAQVSALLNDGLYYVIHSSANPGGELRGQILFP